MRMLNCVYLSKLKSKWHSPPLASAAWRGHFGSLSRDCPRQNEWPSTTEVSMSSTENHGFETGLTIRRMRMRQLIALTTIVVAIIGLSFPGSVLARDDGFFLGASLGYSVIEDDVDWASSVEELDFDESDMGYKVFAGFRWGILGIEGGYVDLGNPGGSTDGIEIEHELSGFDLFGMAILPLGPFDLFAKLGGFMWDSDIEVHNIETTNDDGIDLAAGLGAAFNIGSFGIRAEFEYFDVNSVDKAYMLSAGLVYTF